MQPATTMNTHTHTHTHTQRRSKHAPVGPQDVDAAGHDQVLRDELDELADQGEVAHAAERFRLVVGVLGEERGEGL